MLFLAFDAAVRDAVRASDDEELSTLGVGYELGRVFHDVDEVPLDPWGPLVAPIDEPAKRAKADDGRWDDPRYTANRHSIGWSSMESCVKATPWIRII